MIILWFVIHCHLIRFNENIITDPGHVDIFPVSRIPKQLHHLTKAIYRPSSFSPTTTVGTGSNIKEKGLRLTTEPNSLCSILQLVSDNEVTDLLLGFYSFQLNRYSPLAPDLLMKFSMPNKRLFVLPFNVYNISNVQFVGNIMHKVRRLQLFL